MAYRSPTVNVHDGEYVYVILVKHSLDGIVAGGLGDEFVGYILECLHRGT